MSLRRKIAVLITQIDKYYQSQLWKSLHLYAEQYGYDLIFISGHPIDSYRGNEKNHNVIYKLLNKEEVDGIILTSGTLANYIDYDTYMDFLKPYKGKPTVSLSIPANDCFNIELDNKTSMQTLVSHMINHHNYKKIGFIAGSMTNQEAVDRLSGYRSAIEESGISFDEKLVYECSFFEFPAQEIIDYFFGNTDIDALVCSSDEMAVSIVNHLKKFPRESLQDISITGFDNLPISEGMFPSLTTIKQPYEAMGQYAIKALHSQFNHEHQGSKIDLLGELVIRESCGCVGELHIDDYDPSYFFKTIQTTDLRYSSVIDFIENHKKALLKHIYLLLSKSQFRFEIDSQVEELIESLITDLRREKVVGDFIHKLKSLSFEYLSSNKDKTIIGEVLYTLSKIFSLLETPDHLQNTLQLIFELALIQIGDMRSRQNIIESYKHTKRYYKTTEIITSMNLVKSRNDLGRTVISILEDNFFHQFRVCLFDEPIDIISGQVVLPKYNTTFINFVNGEDMPPETFLTEKMIPQDTFEKPNQSSVVIYPLIFINRFYGFVLIDLLDVDKYVLESLKQEIISALERLYIDRKLIEEHRKLEKLVNTDILSGVLNRRGFFKQASQIFDQLNSHKNTFAIVFCDINRLKIINDQYGHEEGDFTIETIGSLLNENTTSRELVARIGGDEFLVLIENDQLQNYCQIWISNLQNMIKVKNKQVNKPYELSLSIGICYNDPQAYSTLDELIREADHQMYKDKVRKHSR